MTVEYAPDIGIAYFRGEFACLLRRKIEQRNDSVDLHLGA
jgi:hypothetical protein